MHRILLAFALVACSKTPLPRETPVTSIPTAVASAAPECPDASTPPSVPAVPTASEKTRSVSLSLVLTDRSEKSTVIPFAGGAVIEGGSLLAIVLGNEVKQDPAWLKGLPEYINWDGGVTVVARADQAAPTLAGFSVGTEAWTGAGNLRGPSDEFAWNGQRWAPHSGSGDTRLFALENAGYDVYLHSYLPSGDLIALCGKAGETTTHHYAPRASQAVVHVLEGEHYMGTFMANDAAAPYFCSSDGLWQLTPTGWQKQQLPDDVHPDTCALQTDGTVWVYGIVRGLFSRTTEWARVVLADDATPLEVKAAGNRIWIRAHHSDRGMMWLSNEPVNTPLSLDEDHMVVRYDEIAGMSGLNLDTVDVASVSAAPAGPATAACTSVVLYLGEQLTPALNKTLTASDATRDLHLVQASGIVPGKLVLAPRGGLSSMGLDPSRKRRKAYALLAPDLATAERARKAIGNATTRLLCAACDVTKRLR